MTVKPALFITLFSIVVLFYSCKKNSNPTPTTTPAAAMKFTLNGNSVSYKNCIALYPFANGNFEALILANNNTPIFPGVNSLEIRIIVADTLKLGQTYSAATATGQIGSSSLYYSPNGTDAFATQFANPQGAVTITKKTATSVSGTFSCKLFAESDTSGTTVAYTITDGSFTTQ